MFSASSLAAAPVGSVLSSERGKSAGIKFPPTASLSCFHTDCDGHVASEGRRRRKFVLANRRRGKIGRSAANPIAFKNDLLFINPKKTGVSILLCDSKFGPDASEQSVKGTKSSPKLSAESRERWLAREALHSGFGMNIRPENAPAQERT